MSNSSSSLASFQFQQALLDIKQENYDSFVTSITDFSHATEVNICNNLERKLIVYWARAFE